MIMSKKLGLTFVAAALVTLYGCGKEEPKKAEAPKAAAPVEEVVVVKIGHAGPLTGGIAHLGKDNENGVRLALDEANARNLKIGGKKVRFELIAEDDQADPKMGPTIAQKFADAKVAGVVGHLNSGVTIPASAVYNQAGIPMISGSATNPKLTEQGFKNVFRVVGRDDQQGPAVAQYLAGMKIKKVAIADDATAYGEGLANEVEKTLKAAGVQIVAREKTNDKATDFKAILTKMKGKAPDAVFYGGMDATGGPMIKQARELGIKSVFAFGDGACTTEMAKLAGGAAEGLICSQAGLPVEAASQDFVKAFNAKYGEIKQYAPFTLRCRAAPHHRDAEGRFDRSGEVPARAAEDQHERLDRQDRVRRQGRPQERRDHDLHAEGRQGRSRSASCRAARASSFDEFMKAAHGCCAARRTRPLLRRPRLRLRKRRRSNRSQCIWKRRLRAPFFIAGAVGVNERSKRPAGKARRAPRTHALPAMRGEGRGEGQQPLAVARAKGPQSGCRVTTTRPGTLWTPSCSR